MVVECTVTLVVLVPFVPCNDRGGKGYLLDIKKRKGSHVGDFLLDFPAFGLVSITLWRASQSSVAVN